MEAKESRGSFIDFKPKTVTKDRSLLMIKGSIHKEDTKFVNIYASNTGAPICRKEM